jgi:hypothetical protein
MRQAASDPQVNPEPPENDDDQDERPAIKITARGLIGIVAFLLLALAALYFLLPKLAGLDDTWKRIEDGRPAWTIAALVLTGGMFLGYVVMFRGVYGRAAERIGGPRRLAPLRGGRRRRARGHRLGAAPRGHAQAHRGRQDDLVPRPDLLPVRGRRDRVRLRAALRSVQRARPDLADPRPGHRRLHHDRDRHRARVRAAGPPAPVERARLIEKLANVPAASSAGLRDAIEHIRSRNPALIGAVLFWAFQIAVLWAAFHAFGDSPTIAVLVQGFFIGMLGNLLPIPGGVGGVEGGMVGAYTAFGVDFDLALVAVLVFRAFTFWLPLIPGVIAYFRLRRTVDGWKHDRAASAAA